MLIYSVFVHIYTVMILLIRNFAYDSDYYMQEENILTHKKLTFLLTEKVVTILKIKFKIGFHTIAKIVVV